MHAALADLEIPTVSTHLTAAERQNVISLVQVHGSPELSDKLASHFEVPLETSLLLNQMTRQAEATEELRKAMVDELRATRTSMETEARATREETGRELRSTRWQVVGVVTLALVIQAGMVGLSVSLGGAAIGLPDVSVTPLGEAAGEAAAPRAPAAPASNDDAAQVGETVDTATL